MHGLCSKFAAKFIWLKLALVVLPDATRQLTHAEWRRELEPKQLKNDTRRHKPFSTNLIMLNVILILAKTASNAIQQKWVIPSKTCNSTPHRWGVKGWTDFANTREDQNDTMHRTNNQRRNTHIRNMFHQTPNKHHQWPETCHAVWRMARLESRRRARQAAIPPRVGACSLRSGDT